MAKSFKYMDIHLLDDAVRGVDAHSRPPSGWSKAVREALGMTREQLAKRIGSSPSTVATLERSEARGAITIGSLEKLAHGLGGRLVYAIVPHEGKSFEQMVTERAEAIAMQRLGRVSHTMKLEDQTVSKSHQERQLKRIVDGLLQGSRRALWR